MSDLYVCGHCRRGNSEDERVKGKCWYCQAGSEGFVKNPQAEEPVTVKIGVNNPSRDVMAEIADAIARHQYPFGGGIFYTTSSGIRVKLHGSEAVMPRSKWIKCGSGEGWVK